RLGAAAAGTHLELNTPTGGRPRTRKGPRSSVERGPGSRTAGYSDLIAVSMFRRAARRAGHSAARTPTVAARRRKTPIRPQGRTSSYVGILLPRSRPAAQPK